jgi:membrane associated rhomboid family serine protease
MLRNLPTVVRNLLIINALFFLGSSVIGGAEAARLFAGTFPTSPFFKPWQVVTHMFMHADLMHIAFNMLALVVFGSHLERLWGPKRFLNYYLICGLGAFVLHEGMVGYGLYSTYGEFFLRPADLLAVYGTDMASQSSHAIRILDGVYGQVVGASGAVFGLLLAFGTLFPNTRLMLLFPPIPIKAKYLVFGMGAYALLRIIQDSPGDNVAHFAHLGGMLFGYILLKRWQHDRGTFY